MTDATISSTEESTYECFACGTVVRSPTDTDCPECGAEMRNRRIPIE